MLLYDSELEPRKFDYTCYWTDATEEEFNELLNDYLTENNIQEDKSLMDTHSIYLLN